MKNSASDSRPQVNNIFQWLTFATIFAPAVYAILIADALLHGSTSGIAGPIAFIVLFTLLWLISYFTRLRYPRPASFLRFLLPIILYGLFYGQVHAMLAAARPATVDAGLAAIDRAIFGVNPIAWLGTHGHPIITDLLYISYFSYYFGMPVLMILMWHNSPEDDFRVALSAMVMGWYGALITYALFPALGPGRFMPGQMPALTGWLPTTGWIRSFLMVNLPDTVRDSVPSMHTGVTLLTLIFARRYQRKFFRISLIPGLGVIAATMYSQQHYVTDVVLGIIACGFIYTVAVKTGLR